MRLIDADALIEEYDRVHVGPPGGARKLMEDAPTIETERMQDVQLETMSDGTLHITATVDVANINRILLSQAGTHWGDVYYKDDERKKGKWVHGREIAREMIGDCTTAIYYGGWTCSECGFLVEEEREPLYKYCPNCGSYNGGGQDE